MARTIIEHTTTNQPADYVWLSQTKLDAVTVNSGTFKWTVNMDKGTVSLGELPIDLNANDAIEIISALQEILPMLKPENK